MSTAPTAKLANTRPSGWAQSLADGAAGIMLVHIERARAGEAGWDPVHHLARAMAAEPIQAHPDTSSLFYGAPAVAYALHTAGHPAYRKALAKLDDSITALITDELQLADRRIEQRRLPHAREYDLINGLTGLGVYLLHRYHDDPLLRGILSYLVRLTHPLSCGERSVPGWWSAGSPDRRHAARWHGGHAAFGMAHGIAGPLALLSVAMHRGVTVDQHDDAIHAICAWLDQWRARQETTTWWPEVIDRTELGTGTVAHAAPHRPSWCYGTPGIARALQLAAIATRDPHRVKIAEEALLSCLTDAQQLDQLTDAGLCHGWAGLLHTARRAAADALTTDLAAAATNALERMRQQLREPRPEPTEGFLEGTAGVDLVAANTTGHPPDIPRWDACLLVGG